ncbi:MAG: hypothetical protein JO048_09660, partial [Methylobacteriaceae bacterium]|nr:hypothetical protein [Methylobacteriaceae bacterium]
MAFDVAGESSPEARDQSELPPEIAFLRDRGVAEETLRRAARVARRCRVGAEEALIREGLLSEDAFYRALAAEIGAPFRVDGLAVHPEARFPEAALTGVLPLSHPGRLVVAAAPRGPTLRKLIGARGQVARHLVVTTPTALRAALILARGEAVAELAANGLPRLAPRLSYRDGVTLGQLVAVALVSFAAGASAVAWPETTRDLAAVGLCAAFLAGATPRLAAPFEPNRLSAPVPRLPESLLPVYTVIVPLHR